MVVVVGPVILGVIWALAGSVEPTWLPNHVPVAYGFLAVVSAAFGLLFWIDSPARLRKRLLSSLLGHQR